jgi:hypothetical protein
LLGLADAVGLDPLPRLQLVTVFWEPKRAFWLWRSAHTSSPRYLPSGGRALMEIVSELVRSSIQRTGNGAYRDTHNRRRTVSYDDDARSRRPT